MNLSDDLIRHELRNFVAHNMTRSRSQSTDSISESVKSTINDTKQSLYIDEILQDDIGHSLFCLSCCFKFDDKADFLKHLSQHHSTQIKLTYCQEKFFKQSSLEYRFISISIDSKIKAKFLRKYSHDLIVLNEEVAVMLDELNKEENEEEYYSDPSDKELSVNDENNFYDLRPKLSLLFVDYSIVRPGRIFSYLKELFAKSYSAFKSNGDDARKEISISDDMMRIKESNGNKFPRKASGQVFHSRNACKKLKCPKCNWHYKYRETLDIHMREKHSTDLSQTMSQQCIYCIENISHPRLGRGEQYKCGYKPYRCDICDYSTTTKGNLSIHMQSDKHINNLKEIASKPVEKTDTKEIESIDSIDSNRKLLNKKYLNSRIMAGNLAQDQSNNSLTTTSNKSKSIWPQTEIDISLLCPLCHIGFNQQILLEKHLKESHCVSNEDTIKNLVKTARKSEQTKTMKTSSDDEFVDTNQENDLKMNVDNQTDADLFLDNLINKHNDILDTLLSNYLFKNRLIYKNFLANLTGNNQSVISENLDTTFIVQCSDCSNAKYSNLTDLKKHLIDSHDQDSVQLSKSLVQNCIKHFTASIQQDELKNFITSNSSNLSENLIDTTISSLILNRMNKTFSLNKPAASKLPFSAESLLSNQPKQAPPHQSENQLLSYLKSAQMASGQPTNPLFNQFFLPFMFSPSPITAAAAGPGATPQPAPVSPDINDDSLKSDNLDESLDVQSAANRRRRTRITEEQLKILRQYFDINKSPTDEQIIDIARQTQLQAKVIKHWFRNTLFKERQKDKDSPYNFNNPPLTQLNLEEYEKTGKIVAEPAHPLESIKFEAKSDGLNELNESRDELNQQQSNEHLDIDENDEQNLSSSRCSSVGMRNRPNRTKFSESQIKALNVAFRQQKYPKDEQISQLASQLGLKPRVITVWFQNARQKARKSTINKEQCDEMNTTNADDLDEYYDMNDDCDETQSHVSSSTDKSSTSPSNGDNALAMAAAQAAAAAANTKALQLQLAMSLLAAHQQQQQQQQQQNQFQNEKLSSSSSSSASSSDSKKNEDEEDELDDDEDEIDDEEDETDSSKLAKVESQNKNAMPSAKRLRTTILPEQQEFLMQKYQIDQNPSRKMLDEIAKQVRLKKRVVQVWFQNTRARERKGIIKINPTINNQSNQNGSFSLSTKMIKKCPNCSQGFRSRNELESHLILKHNYSYEQASSFETSDEEIKSETKSCGVKSPLTYQSNGLNSMLMSTLFAHLHQQQQQQQQHQQQQQQHQSQQQPFDLSFKSKSDSIIKPISQNIENRSRSNSSSGNMNISKLKPFNHSLVKREAQPVQNQRRVRTQMTQYQVNVMRLIFAEYKTPTMNECELMGKEINLKKRVVQVWFQNARAKEKKNNQNANRSILFSNSANNDLSNFEFSSDECLLCGVKYTSSGSGGLSQNQREHLFSKQHLSKLIQFVTKIAVENGANSVDFSAKNGSTKNEDDDESELDDEENSDDEEEQSANQENESQTDNEQKLNSSFDMNRLLQLPQQTPPANSQFYNYFLYSNLLNQPKMMPSLNSTSASSESSSCSTNSTPSSTNTSPPFYSQFQNPVLAQIYAAFAAQQQHGQLTTLEGLNLAKSVQADIEKQLASGPVPGQAIQYTADGSTKNDLIEKYNFESQSIEEHVQTCHYVCRACRSVSASRDALLTHQCLNQIVNMNLIQSSVFKLEQIGYKCVACASDTQPDCVFTNAADFVEHSTKLGHFMIKKMANSAINIKRKDEIDLDSNNNNKKLKY